MRSILVLLVALVGSALHAEIPRPDDAPKPLSPAESKKRFKLPEGFRIDLIASEPLIRDPSCVAWDEKGRLFVTEIHGYNLEGHLDVTELNKTGKLDTAIRRVRVDEEMKAEARKGQNGSLKLLRDTNGDGRMDEAILWADDIPAAYGVVPALGGLVVVAEPDILFFADRDGDDRPDERKVLFTGFGRGEMERAINNPVWGPDNWIYVGRGWAGGTITGPTLQKAVKLGRTDFRLKPDGSAIEPVSGENHTFGMALDDYGTRWLITTGQPARYAAPLPYHYLARNPHVSSPGTTVGASPYHNTFPISTPHPWRSTRGADPRWVKFYGGGEAKPNGNFTSACGQQVYRADLFPKKYHGNHFACEPQQSMVHRSLLIPESSGWRAQRPPEHQDNEFLSSSDGWFRPNNLRVGPDGALYIVDMYREIIEDYSAIPRYLQQQYGLLNGDDRGRIWRLAPKDSSPTPINATGVAEVKSLGHPNAWWRESAQQLLIEEEGTDRKVELARMATDQKGSFQGRVHALCTAEGRGELESATLVKALADPHPEVRRQAVRLAESRLKEEAVREGMVALAREESDHRVLLQLALSLGETEDTEALKELARLAVTKAEVRWMENAVLSSIGSTAGKFLVTLLANHPKAQTSLVERATETAVRSGQKEVLGEVMAALLSHPDEALSLRLLALAAHHGLDRSPRLAQVANKALAVVSDATQLQAKRLAALRLAPYAEKGAVKTAVDVITHPSGDPTFQDNALRELLRSSQKNIAAVVIKALPTLTPRGAAVATEALLGHPGTTQQLLVTGVLSSRSFSALQRHRLLNHEDPKVKELATLLFAERNVEPKEKFRAHYAALKGKADAKRGAELYTMHCATCHRFGGKGTEVGPSLDGEAGRPAESLLSDILSPSQNLTAGYATYLANTRTRQSAAGVLTSESATSVTLTATAGVKTKFLRADLVSLQRLDVSLMPQTFGDAFTPQQAADLVAYLKSRPASSSLVLFDDDPGFPGLLHDGKGEARLDWRDAASGRASLTISGFQRHSRQLPGWKFAIRENPKESEYRYLRLAMKTRKSKGMMLELAADRSFPPENKPVRTYYAGENKTGWKSNELAAKIPTEWQTFTIDLWKGNGDFNLTGMAFTVMDGEASYDRIELLRSKK